MGLIYFCVQVCVERRLIVFLVSVDVIVLCLYLAVHSVGRQCAIVLFPGHTRLLYRIPDKSA